MDLPIPKNQFSEFLCNAKRSTYASIEDNGKVKSILQQSHQLEYREGPFFYRDIYFGGDYFVGLETAYYRNDPIWAMSYAGGLNAGVNTNQAPDIYEFLQEALMRITVLKPYRGPESYQAGKYKYSNRLIGIISRFSGVETITLEDIPMYQLHYSGGKLKR
ncbi:MAG: DUF5680 domain-containing protein [Promethearchaeota archaeon]